MKLTIIKPRTSEGTPSITVQKSGLITFNEQAAQQYNLESWGQRIMLAIDEQETPFQTLYLIPTDPDNNDGYSFKHSTGKYKIWSLKAGKALQSARVDFINNEIRFSYQGQTTIDGVQTHVLKIDTIRPRRFRKRR
jgi:hypothetical protein